VTRPILIPVKTGAVPAGFFMRWYNAAMSKPFQFSMRQMFAEVSLFCVAAWLVVTLSRTNPEHVLFPVAIIALGATLGAAISLPFGRPFIDAALCAVLAALGVWMLYPMISGLVVR
jgi:hypothetical protein